MADKSEFDLLIHRALMNNSFDYDSLDRTLDKTYKNAFSTLLHKHASVVGCPIYQFFSSDESHYKESYENSSKTSVYTESGPGHFKLYEKDPDTGEFRYKYEEEITVRELENRGYKLSYDLWEWNNKQPGNLYIDERNKAAITIPVNLFTTNVLEYRTSRYYDTWIPHYDLITRTDIFYKIPIIIIDDKIVTNYTIKFIADGFTVRLPFGPGFVHDVTYRHREENGRFYDGDRPKFLEHDTRIMIVNNYMNLSYITDLTKFDISATNPYMRIPYTAENSVDNTIEEELNSTMATIRSILGIQIRTATEAMSYLKDAMERATERQKALPDVAATAYERGTISYAYANDYAMYKDLLGIVTVMNNRFNNITANGGIYNEDNGIFFVAFTYKDEDASNIYPASVYNDTNGKGLKISFPEDVWTKLKTIQNKVKITLYYLKDLKRFKFGDSDIIESKYGIPSGDKEGLPLLWLKDGDIAPKKMPVPLDNFIVFNSKDGTHYNIVNAHHTLKLHYPNIYEFIDRMAEDGVDKYQIFYYYQDFDTGRFRPLYQYFFDFIYLYINKKKESGKYPEETLTDIYYLMMSDDYTKMTEYMVNNGYENWTDIDSVRFKEWFDTVFNYEYFEFKYGPADYDRKFVIKGDNTNGKPPMQYKDEIMRELVDRDPYVLRDYVLDQYKLGEYHYIYTRNLIPSLESRLRYKTTDISESNAEYQEFDEPEGRYVFTFLNEHPEDQNLEIRLFVDGILCDDLVSVRSGKVQFVYVPAKMFNTDTEEGSYVWIDVFPGFSWQRDNMLNFTSLDDEVGITIPVLNDALTIYCHVVIGSTGEIIGIYDDEHIEIMRQVTGMRTVPIMLDKIASGEISVETIAGIDNIGALSSNVLYADITTAKVYRYQGGHCALEKIEGIHAENIFPTIQDLRFMEKMETEEQIASSADTSLEVGDYISYSKNFFTITGEYKFYTDRAYYYESSIEDNGKVYPVRFPRVVHLRIRPKHEIVLNRPIQLSVRKKANEDTAILIDKTKELKDQYTTHIHDGNIPNTTTYQEYLDLLVNRDIDMYPLPMERAILDDYSYNKRIWDGTIPESMTYEEYLNRYVYGPDDIDPSTVNNDDTILDTAEITLQFDNAHNEFNFSKEYIRLFHNGRIISELQYFFNRGRVCPKIRLLYPEQITDITKQFPKYMENDRIHIDVTPYRFRRVYYAETIPDTYFIDLTGYVNKPFDIRYFDVYLNGRRLGTQNVVNISPASIALINVKSRKNLVIYERERDYEFYGQDYTRTDIKYRDFAKFIDNDFIDHVGGPRKLVVYEIDRRKDEDCLVVPNTDDEDEYDFKDLISNLEFAEFYYNELVPKTSANPSQRQYSYDTLKEEYPNICRIYVNDAEKYILLDPDTLVTKGGIILPSQKNPDTNERVFVVGHPDRVDETYPYFEWDRVNEINSELGGEKN